MVLRVIIPGEFWNDRLHSPTVWEHTHVYVFFR